MPVGLTSVVGENTNNGVNDTLVLKCFDEIDIITQISAGYMNKRERKIIVLSYKKIKIDQVVLKKNR